MWRVRPGTAQQSKSHPNHALFVGFAPYESPEIAIAVRIANGYTSANCAEVGADVFKYYFNLADEEDILSRNCQRFQRTDNRGLGVKVMSNQSVIIKSNRYGLIVILDEKPDWETIKKEVAEKIQRFRQIFWKTPRWPCAFREEL